METKTCTKCKVEKPIERFGKRKNRPSGLNTHCKDCQAAYMRTRYRVTDSYREWLRGYSKKRYYELKAQLIEAYGGKCQCCGETEPKFLTIDHINGDGAEQRRNGEGSGGPFYYRLRTLGFPKDVYRLLCYNCNCSRRQFGQCPHETARQGSRIGLRGLAFVFIPTNFLRSNHQHGLHCH
jgi:hypothetical protein